MEQTVGPFGGDGEENRGQPYADCAAPEHKPALPVEYQRCFQQMAIGACFEVLAYCMINFHRNDYTTDGGVAGGVVRMTFRYNVSDVML